MSWSPGWVARRLVLRALWRERGRALLAVLAVALGVSVFLAIRLANRAAVASFEAFARGVGQGADWLVQAEAGPLDERELPRLQGLRDAAWIRPVIEGSFSRRGSLEPFQVLGVDLVGLGGTVAGEPAAASAPADLAGARAGFYASIQDPDAVMVSRTLARELGLAPGSALEGLVDERPVRLRVAGILPEDPARPPVERNLLVMDLPAAQRLLGRPGQLDRLELGARGGDPRALEAPLRAALPPQWTLEPPEQQASSGRTMTAAFRFNLTVLSLLALAVGAYLLFQAFDAAVNRRRETWATLRSLGCEPGRVRRLVLGEALVLGALGSGLGLLLGWALAQGTVRAVARTVNALYGASSARRAVLAPEEGLLAFALGLGACLLAAWIPARRASAVPPAQLLARGSDTGPVAWGALTATGLLALAAGAALAFLPQLPPGVAWHAYGGAVLILLGGSLAAVGLLPLLGLPGLRTGRWRGRLALRPLLRPTGRHAFAAAALAVAVAMTVGMGTMVQSFEGTVLAWIDASLRADLYVAPLGNQGAASRHRMSPETVAALGADPDVAALDQLQILPVELRGQRTFLGAADFRVLGTRARFVMVEGAGPAPDGEGALVSETFSRRFGVHAGQMLELPTPEGPRSLRVRGVYADYGNERGSVLMDRSRFQAWFHDPRAANVALYLRPGADAEAAAARVRVRFPALQVRRNGALREQVRTVFRQTFALTYALELVGLAVALGGLAQALVGLALQRRGDLWTLRALGASEAEVAGVLMGEGLGVALAGLLGGTALGLVLARLLVDVLNPQVFGWTLKFAWPGRFLGLVALLVLGAAAAVLLPAARWGARLRADREAEEG